LYLSSHNTKRNYPITALNKSEGSTDLSDLKNHSSPASSSNELNNNSNTANQAPLGNNNNKSTENSKNYSEMMKLKSPLVPNTTVLNQQKPLDQNSNQFTSINNIVISNGTLTKRINDVKKTNVNNYSSDSGNNSDEILTSASASPANSDTSKEIANKIQSTIAAMTTNNSEQSAQMNGAIDSAVRKFGWLSKLSQNGLRLWRKRYFVLTDYILDYYSGTNNKNFNKNI
jgi:hypothetical protein